MFCSLYDNIDVVDKGVTFLAHRVCTVLTEGKDSETVPAG